MSVFLPQPGSKSAVLMAVAVVALGAVVAVAFVRGLLASMSMHAWMQDPSVVTGVPSPPVPRSAPK